MNSDGFDLKTLKHESGLAVERISEEALRHLFPLNSLSTEQLNSLRSSMSVKPLRANREVFKVGEAPEEAFWLLDGVIQLVDAKEERLESVTAGEDLMMPLPYVVPAVETAQCVVDCRFLTLSRKKLNDLLKREHLDPRLINEGRGTLRSSEELYREFEQLRDEQKNRLREKTSDNDPGSDLTFAPHVDRLPSTGSRVAPITKHLEVLGEPSRSGSRGSAKPSSTEPEARPVGTDDLRRAFDAFAKRPGYRKLGLNVRAECLMHSESLNYEPRQTIVKQGDRSQHWYLILQGECQVEFQAGEASFQVNKYAWGDTFGEDGLITEQRRNASVIATTAVRVLRLSSDDFRRLLVPSLLHSIDGEQLEGDPFGDALIVDLRLPRERSDLVIDGALEVPWPLMRSHRFPDAVDQKRVVLVASNEIEAMPLAFMLRKFGFEAYYLAGGFGAMPKERMKQRSINHRPAPGGIVRIV